MPDELWAEVRDIVQETGSKTIPMEKKCKKAKWLSGEVLQIAVKRGEVKSKGAKERYSHFKNYSIANLFFLLLLFFFWKLFNDPITVFLANLKLSRQF